MDSNLFSNFDAFSVAYVNHEGVELPLKNVKDFNEAIRSAKCKGKNHLKLIFYDHKLKANEATALNNSQSAKSQKVPLPCTDIASNNFSKCIEDSFPEWFKQYMMKIKKKILEDLKTTIKEIIQEECEKRKKLDEAKLFKLLSCQNEFSSPKKFKKKKKTSGKKGFDHSKKRDIKQPKKICQIKLKEAEKIWEHEKKSIKSGKSAIFYKNDIFLFLLPGAEFSVTVNILNNGTIPWLSPRMECFSSTAVLLQELVIRLPRLEPGESANVTLRGKVSEKLGNYYFAYKLFDGSEDFGPLFQCFPVVADSKKVVINSSGQLKVEKTTSPTESKSIDFKNYLIESSQEKINENLNEIKKSLQDLHFARFCASCVKSREANLYSNAGNFEFRCCSLMQDKEKKYSEEKLEEGVFGVQPLKKREPEKAEQMDANVLGKNFETNNYGKDSDSESKLSVLSEESQNSPFVPFISEGSNSKTSENLTKLPKVDLNKESKETNQKPKESHPARSDVKENSCKESNCLCSRLLTEEERFSKKAEPSIESCCTAESRGVIFNENAKENVLENIKIFKEGDRPRENSGLKENPVSHSAEETPFSETTKSWGKTNYAAKAFENVFNFLPLDILDLLYTKEGNAARKNHKIYVRTVDSLGRPIYAVRMDGCCIPVKDL